MELLKQNKIYSIDDFSDKNRRRSLYHSVIKCPDGKVRMYVNQWNGFHRTVFRESNDGINFDETEHVIIKKSGVSHNFYPFYGKDNKLYAIGGVDSWKHEKKWREVEHYQDFLVMFKERFGQEYTRDEARFENFKKVISAKKHLDHTSGLYLFQSTDGVKWEIMNDGQPIVTTRHPGYFSALHHWGDHASSSEFDSHLSCVWDGEKYILYVRKNIRWGIRFIQYTTSKDLINWAPYQELKLDKFDRTIENYYSPVVMNYQNNFFGLIPFFYEKNNTYGSIKFIGSQDGENFNIIKDILEGEIILLKGKPKTRMQFVNGYVENGSKLYFYIHHNYLGVDSRKPVKVIRYEIDKKDMEKYLK